MNILIVEDEEALASAIEHILQKANHVTDVVMDGQTAVEYIENATYDLILLDLMLPKMDGFQVVERIRGEHIDTPVLMLTARTATSDKVAGLNAGADDYLTKPFEPEELLARVNALTRRRGEVILNDLTFGDLTLHLDSNDLECSGETVRLSGKEMEIARLFFTNPQMTYTKDMLISRVWGLDSDVTDNNVEAYISFLRKKLRFLKSCVSIKNLQRVGYRMEEDKE